MNRDQELELDQLKSIKWTFDQGISGPNGITSAELARLEYLQAKAKADAEAKAAEPKAAAVAARAERAALPRAVNPVMLEADIKPPKRRVDGAVWLAAVNKAAAQRELGDVTGAVIVQIASKIAWAVAKGAGVGRIALRVLGKLAVCCKETARKVVRYLEDWGLLKTANIMHRRGRKLWRTMNAYELALPPATGGVARYRAPLFERKVWWAAAVNLHARAIGLNTTPLRQPGET